MGLNELRKEIGLLKQGEERVRQARKLINQKESLQNNYSKNNDYCHKKPTRTCPPLQKDKKILLAAITGLAVIFSILAYHLIQVLASHSSPLIIYSHPNPQTTIINQTITQPLITRVIQNQTTIIKEVVKQQPLIQEKVVYGDEKDCTRINWVDDWGNEKVSITC